MLNKGLSFYETHSIVVSLERPCFHGLNAKLEHVIFMALTHMGDMAMLNETDQLKIKSNKIMYSTYFDKLIF